MAVRMHTLVFLNRNLVIAEHSMKVGLGFEGVAFDDALRSD